MLNFQKTNRTVSTALLSAILGCGMAMAAISSESILARTKILSSDEFEGRSPGSAGEEKTVEYLINEFKKTGLQPGNPDGTYVQEVPLVGITSNVDATFHAGRETITFQPMTEFTASSPRLTEQVAVNASDIVFVGYGVVAPEYHWDDYKGMDVRGKTLLMLVNDPPVIDPATRQLDPEVFKGNAMTYYGRWTYKYDIAAKKGAAAVLVIHETGPAGYPFAVLGTGWGREGFDLVTPDRNQSRAAVEGWVTASALQRLLTASGQDFETLKAAAVQRDFKPVALGAKATFAVENSFREVASKNVLAKLQGSDPAHRDEYLVYTAHWDHLGRDPRLKGDQIYNGAADNAAGIAVLLELAEAFVELPPKERPKRSILFLAVTAEEKGLLGSRYYAQNPLYPLNQTLASINMDGANQFGPTRDMTTIGFGASTIDDIGVAVAASQGREMKPEIHPEHGYYYRSDHFEFAKVGVPAYYPKSGALFIGQPADFGEKLIQDYLANRYHKVGDEVQPNWTFEGAAQDTEFLLKVGLEIANSPHWPQWREGNEFKARRDAMMKASDR
ncbi:MAG TPA: M28 family peptidase [Opitutus sp.]|nr:M28 family peptidase [Opitutus sp.]